MAAPASELIAGRATPEGTARYAARYAARLGAAFYRPLAELSVASLGFGTSRGACDDADDVAYATAIRRALSAGVNLVDTAVNYRCQRAERTVGRVLALALAEREVSRDEVVVCTKGGFLPDDGVPASTTAERVAYLRREWLDAGIFCVADVVQRPALHCLVPAFVADQIARSRTNLGVATLDVYYLHNPEHQLAAGGADRLYGMLHELFALLEERCAAGELGVYGCATWSGFRVGPDHPEHLSLARLVELAREVGGDAHHFRVAQAPLSLSRDEAAVLPTQPLPDGRVLTFLEAATELGIAVVASGALSQGELAESAESAERALAFARSMSVASALVGTKNTAHLDANLGMVHGTPHLPLPRTPVS